MRTLLFILIAIALSGCATKRVLVKDCQKLNGMGDTGSFLSIKRIGN